MKKLGSLLVSVLLMIGTAQAQDIIKSLERDVPGQGKVTIHQDTCISFGSTPLKKHSAPSLHHAEVAKDENESADEPSSSHSSTAASSSSTLPSFSLTSPSGTSTTSTMRVVRYVKARGYRVQVYAGNNSRQAHNEALRIGAKVKDYFPDVRVYSVFISPRWLCRVGDFRSMGEAQSMLRELKSTRIFKEVSIVKDNINVPQ